MTVVQPYQMRRPRMILTQTQRHPRWMRLALTLCVALLLATLVGAGLPLGVAAAATPKPKFSTRSLFFGYQALDTTSAPQTVTLKARGNSVPFTISSVTVTGANASEFAITTNTCTGQTLSKNKGCSVSVTFKPAGTGTRSASLEFV